MPADARQRQIKAMTLHDTVGLNYAIRRQQKFYSLPISDTNRFYVSSEGPSSGISVGGRVKHACFYTSEYIKTTRDKIKTNQMDLIKTRNK